MTLLLLLVQDPDGWLQLKDGGLLHVRYDPGSIALDGVALTEAGTILPGVWYDGTFDRRADELIAALSAEAFERRESATAELLKLGTAVTEKLRRAAAPDPEVGARIRELLRRIGAGEGGRAPAARPDRVDAREGRLTPDRFTFRWRGVETSIPWTEIESVSPKPGPRTAAAAAPSEFRRRVRGDFPATDRVIDFDTDPSGNAIAQGTNVENVYADWGVTFDTEVEDSVVYADSFVVESGSHGNSGATQNPVWTGNVTLTFSAGGVHRVGVYVASVSPGGTGMRVYGLDGAELHTLLTTGGGTDFLGIESPVLIHRVEIFDAPEIDPNFTTDDWVFGPILSPDGDADRFTVELAGGERVRVRILEGDAESVNLGIASVSARDVREVRPPTRRVRSWGTFEVRGAIVRWDDQGIVVRDGDAERTVRWEDFQRFTLP